jgi:hypothetical protein
MEQELSNLYINEEGCLCYQDSYIKDTLYVQSIFENVFGIIFNVYPKKTK